MTIQAPIEVWPAAGLQGAANTHILKILQWAGCKQIITAGVWSSRIQDSTYRVPSPSGVADVVWPLRELLELRA